MKDAIRVSQYCDPFSYDLQGRTFHLIEDGGREMLLHFTDGMTVETALKGEAFLSESCEVLKADDTTYFVHLMPEAARDLIHVIYVLDTAQRLFTSVSVVEGFDPKMPRLMKVTPSFGAIKVPGMRLPETRHSLTRAMTGIHMNWHPGPSKRGVTHIYYSPTRTRTADKSRPEITMRAELSSEDPAVRKHAEEVVRWHSEREKWYPIYEEPSFRIRINDHLQLFSFVEENQVLFSPGHSAGGGGMILVQDVVRLKEVGISFNPADLRYTHTLLMTAYGDIDVSEDKNDTAPSPFDFMEHRCMPSNLWPIPSEDNDLNYR